MTPIPVASAGAAATMWIRRGSRRSLVQNFADVDNKINRRTREGRRRNRRFADAGRIRDQVRRTASFLSRPTAAPQAEDAGLLDRRDSLAGHH